MKIFKTALFALIVTITLIGCKKITPTACFSYYGEYNDTLFKEKSTIYFHDCSLNATSYKWSFGDGTTSNAYNPGHVYTTAGTYTVSHEVFSEDGETSDINTTEIVIQPLDIKTVQIITVTMHKFPEFDATGAYWDGSQWDGPDVLFWIYNQGTGNVVFTNVDTKYDCILGNTYIYPLNSNAKFATQNNSVYEFEFIENNWGIGQSMGTVEFKVNDYLGTLPSTIDLQGDGFEISLDVYWLE